MPRLRNDEERIIRLWKSIDFPGSFGNSKDFRRELKKHANINISQRALDDIIHKDLVYQMSHIKRQRNSKSRKVTSTGVTIQVKKSS